jgi:hypothetical protein
MKQGLIIDEYGTKYWYLNGKYHRDDGPALEWTNSGKEWYLNGLRHRVDGPARELSNGSKAWFLNGRLVYSKNVNNLHKYPNLSKPFKQSIVKYRLTI